MVAITGPKQSAQKPIGEAHPNKIQPVTDRVTALFPWEEQLCQDLVDRSAKRLGGLNITVSTASRQHSRRSSTLRPMT